MKQTENERLLLSADFLEKFELVFALTQENEFSERFHFQVDRKSIGLCGNNCKFSTFSILSL